ncbi:MAG: hypothetical protein R3C26_00195 [Calditrichia bacterium]
MRDLRIVFMGTPEFAVTMAAIHNSRHKIVGVVSNQIVRVPAEKKCCPQR